MKKYTITELSDHWLLDGGIEIPKHPRKRKPLSWFEAFVHDLFNFYN